MAPPRRRTVLRGIGLASTALLAGCAALADSTVPNDDSAEPASSGGDDTQAFAYASGGGGCLPDQDPVESGWIHTVAHGEGYDVTFDVLLAHGRKSDASASLTHAGMDDYDLTFSAGERETERTKTPIDADCAFGTRIRGGGSVPTDFERLRVVGGDGVVQTVEREGTGPRLHRVPTPMDV